MPPASRHDTDKRVIRTKRSIKKALFKLMETNDISSITISRLTEDAGINRRTFYTHYSNITDILEETETEIAGELSKLIEEFDPGTPAESTATLFVNFNKLISEDFGDYFRLMNSDFRGALSARLRNMLKSVSTKAVGRFALHGKRYSELFVSFINGGFMTLFIEWTKNDRGIPIDKASEIAGALVDLCIKSTGDISYRIGGSASDE